MGMKKNIDDAERLKVKTTTLRELYLKSGNKCAFPGCSHVLVDEKGIFQGQVCHIEAASKGGPRFNNTSTNEDRRDIKNLILLCKDHHTEIDTLIDEYTVEGLQAMKRNHEKKCKEALDRLLSQMQESSIYDYSQGNTPKYAKNAEKLNSLLSLGLNKEELDFELELLNGLLDRIKNLAPDTLELLAIMVNHSTEVNFTQIVDMNEVILATRNRKIFYTHYSVMEKYGVAYIVDEESSICKLQNINMENPWKHIKEFCEKAGIPLSSVFTSKDFSVFDE